MNDVNIVMQGGGILMILLEKRSRSERVGMIMTIGNVHPYPKLILGFARESLSRPNLRRYNLGNIAEKYVFCSWRCTTSNITFGDHIRSHKLVLDHVPPTRSESADVDGSRGAEISCNDQQGSGRRATKILVASAWPYAAKLEKK